MYPSVAKYLFTVVTFISLSHLGLAQDLSGSYGIKGKDASGDSFTSTFSFEKHLDSIYFVKGMRKYKSGKEVAIDGTGILDLKNRQLSIAFGLNESRYGLMFYSLNDNGGLDGLGWWFSPSGDGAELMDLENPEQSEIAGEYPVTGITAEGDLDKGAEPSYEGTLSITEVNKKYRLGWDLKNGLNYGGLGIVTGKQLVGVWGLDKDYGLEIFQFNDDYTEASSIAYDGGNENTGKSSLKKE